MNINNNKQANSSTRRVFIIRLTKLFSALGLFLFSVPFIKSLMPNKTPIKEIITVNVGNIKKGEGITVKWNNQPIFIRRRTNDEISAAQQDDNSENLIEKEADSQRVLKPEWLVVFASCTHMGCLPMGIKSYEKRGSFGGFLCQCHGAEYDTSGRVRKGPAAHNLAIPPYRFINEETIEIGQA